MRSGVGSSALSKKVKDKEWVFSNINLEVVAWCTDKFVLVMNIALFPRLELETSGEGIKRWIITVILWWLTLKIVDILSNDIDWTFVMFSR